MKYFIDTNIFLRAFTGDNKKQYSEAVQILFAIKTNKIDAYTNNLVIAEINWTLSRLYGLAKQTVIEYIETIIHLNGLKIEDMTDLNKALELYKKSSVKFIDSLIASNKDIHSMKMTVLSYDSDFGKLPVLWKKPADVLRS